MNVCVKLTVKGRVQGVGFRWTIHEYASTLGVTGYVKNLYNGDVEILAEGERERVEDLIEYIKKGPRFSKVTDVTIEWKDFAGRYDSFDITF